MKSIHAHSKQSLVLQEMTATLLDETCAQRKILILGILAVQVEAMHQLRIFPCRPPSREKEDETKLRPKSKPFLNGI